MWRSLLLALSCACGSGVPEGADAAPVVDASTCAPPVSLAQGGMISRLAMDATDVYWLETDPMPPTLHRTPRMGGATATLATQVGSFTLDTDNVYYAAVETNDAGSATTLYALPKSAGPAVQIASLAAYDLVVDATTLYVLGSPAGAILGVPKTGGSPITIMSGTPPAVRLVGVDDTTVYWTSGAAPLSTIWATPKNGGTSTQLAQLQADIYAATLDGDNLYFTTTNHDLVKLSKATSALTTLTSGLGDFGAENLAVSSGWAYVDQQAPGQYPAVILAVPVDGGPAQKTCAGGSMSISGIAVDATTIAWGLIFEANGSVMTTPK